jgi:tripartite-type tricarboxylate transporter receptor subunit TctC
MKKFKHVLLVALCLVMVAALMTGCSSTQSSSPANNDSEKKAEEKTFPEKTVTTIVSYAAGGGSDILARAIADNINLDGQTNAVVNIEGGSGTIGMLECYNGKPDGYTMALAFPESISVQILGGAVDSAVLDNFEYVGSPVYDVNALSVLSSSKFKTLEELIAYAKDHPNELTIASVGSGINKLCVIDFMQKAGIELKYVPYENSTKSKPAFLGGHVDIWWCQASEAKVVSDSGDSRVLAIANTDRASFFPETPTFTELGYDVVNGLHRGLLVTPDTPAEVVSYLEGKLKEVYDNPEFIKLLEDKLGFLPVWTSSADFKKLSAEALKKNTELMKVVENY